MSNIIIVPGNFASTLYDQNSHHLIWINLIQLGAGGFSKLRLGSYTSYDAERDYQSSRDIVPIGPVPILYNHLQNSLQSAGHSVTFFAYDWRKDIEYSAQQLVSLCSSFLDPPIFISHSEGCVVSARAIQIIKYASLIKHAFMIAPPGAGTFSAALGIAGSINQANLGLFIPVLSHQNVQTTLASFTALYQLLPFVVPVFPSIRNNNISEHSYWNRIDDPDRLVRAFPIGDPWLSTIDIDFSKSHIDLIMGVGTLTAGGVMWAPNNRLVVDHNYDVDGDGFVSAASALYSIYSSKYKFPGVSHLHLVMDQVVIDKIMSLISNL